MKTQKIPNIVIILVLTLITVIMWISLTIYGALTSKPPIVVPKEVSQPITPVLDKDTLNQIESRIFFNDSEIPDNGIATKITCLPNPDSSPSATPLP